MASNLLSIANPSLRVRFSLSNRAGFSDLSGLHSSFLPFSRNNPEHNVAFLTFQTRSGKSGILIKKREVEARSHHIPHSAALGGMRNEPKKPKKPNEPTEPRKMNKPKKPKEPTVPKVHVQLPGDEKGSWVNLHEVLRQERLLFLGEEVNDEVGGEIMSLMIYLSIEDESKDLYLLINSPGGGVLPGIGIYDTMQSVQPHVITICIGLAASTASLALVGGEITKRLAFSHARIMIHQPTSTALRSQNLAMSGYELLKLRDVITNIYVQRTGQPFWVVSEDMERDTFMSATEAKAYGIVDRVGL